VTVRRSGYVVLKRRVMRDQLLAVLAQIDPCTVVVEQRHPLEGRDLEVMGGLRRGGIQLLLIALPDGSRTLVPEQWTNWNPNETDCTLASGDEGRERCIAPLADLLHLRTIVDALLDRESTSRPEPVIDEEGQSCN
jgi:hypothetical protein